MCYDSEDYEDMIANCEIAKRLTPWEEEFIASLRDKYEEGYTFSQSQVDKLEEIWNEKA